MSLLKLPKVRQLDLRLLSQSRSLQVMTEVFRIQQTFFIFVAKSKNFVEAPAEDAPQTKLEPDQEEDIAPPVIDPVLLSLVHQQQATSGDLPMMTVEKEPVSPIQMAPEQSKDHPKPETESSLIPPALSSLSASDLVVATGSGSSTLTIGPISAPS